ncbi:MAG: hypothetical protein KJ749_07185, partial [Planctomycetes bacterium]|nr:hypothetical protein [Planctomycetota bacterium]
MRRGADTACHGVRCLERGSPLLPHEIRIASARQDRGGALNGHRPDLEHFPFSCSEPRASARADSGAARASHAKETRFVRTTNALEDFPLAEVGPEVERAPEFPERINFHIAQVEAVDRIVMKPWERGSGLTRACGTGACAVCVAGVLT